MRRVFAIFVLVELLFAVVLLHAEIRDFLWTHPWWHSFLVLVPTIAVLILAVLELRHSAEANDLRSQANTQRDEANRLRADGVRLQGEANDLRGEQTKHIARIGEMQEELNKLQAERNQSLGKIAENTQKVPTEAENNAAILRKYIGQYARVTEGLTVGEAWAPPSPKSAPTTSSLCSCRLDFRLHSHFPNACVATSCIS